MWFIKAGEAQKFAPYCLYPTTFAVSTHLSNETFCIFDVRLLKIVVGDKMMEILCNSHGTTANHCNQINGEICSILLWLLQNSLSISYI
jgi:hypothetical protein